jgi:hypothetical protein
LRSFEVPSSSSPSGTTTSTTTSRKDPGALEILLRSSGVPQGIDNLGRGHGTQHTKKPLQTSNAIKQLTLRVCGSVTISVRSVLAETGTFPRLGSEVLNLRWMLYSRRKLAERDIGGRSRTRRGLRIHLL